MYMASNIEQFFEKNIAVLTAHFEVPEGEYDDSVLPANVVAAACKKCMSLLFLNFIWY